MINTGNRALFRVWLVWTAATVLGLAAAAVASNLLTFTWLAFVWFGDAASSPFPGGYIFQGIVWETCLLLLVGPGMGWFQALALHKEFGQSIPRGLWVLMTSLAVTIWLLVIVPANIITETPGCALLFPGLIIGTGQSMVFRRCIGNVPNVGWWLIGNIVAWTISLTVCWLIVSTFPPAIENILLMWYRPQAILYFSMLALIGAGLYGATTGFTLVMLIRSRERLASLNGGNVVGAG